MELLDTPLFGVVFTILAYLVGVKIYKKIKLPIFNPILIALLIIIPNLLYFNIPLDTYKKGGNMILFLLAPATVALAVPLYTKIELLKQHLVPILGGITVGVVTSIGSCIMLGRALGLDISIVKSSLAKSLTTPIAMALSEQVGGIVPITIVMVMITGITGAIIAPTVCKVFRIKNKIAKGIAIGTASHGVGTSRAMEMGEVEGAMSGLAIGVAGVITVLIMPILYMIFF